MWAFDSGVPAAARAPRGRDELGARSASPQRIGIRPDADAQDLAPGAVLDVWLNDPHMDMLTLSSVRSLGNAVVRGDFFRYTSVNSDPDLRAFWGQPLLLKWSALLEIKTGGPHVFAAELLRERGPGALFVRTMVRVDGETVFEKDLRVLLGAPISETGSRELSLAPGFHRLEVWLAARNPMGFSPSTQLGTYLKIRGPNDMTLAPVQLSQLWHRMGPGERS